jgi:hypothetical protein
MSGARESGAPADGQLPRALGDGLTLRQATMADREALLAFTEAVHDPDGAEEMRFVLDGLYPEFRIEDVLLVVDAQGRIASSLCLIPLRWQIGDTWIDLGQVEFVGTHADYRGRGLVRTQMAVVHRWMAERGFPFGYIWGIPYFYRQFGYAYAVDARSSGYLEPERHADRIHPLASIGVRPITEADVPALLELEARQCAQADIRSAQSAEGLRWLARRGSGRYRGEGWAAIEDDRIIGLAKFFHTPEGTWLYSVSGEDRAAAAFIATALGRPGVTRLLVDDPPDSPTGRVASPLRPDPAPPESIYIRANDPVLAFQALRPELERRLAASSSAGLSRAIELGFYRFGIRLDVDAGRIVRIERLPGDQDPAIGIPPEVLPLLLFGYRDVDAIADLYPDFAAKSHDDWALLRVLFPRLRACLRSFMA